MQSRETNEEFAREQENANKGWETCYGAALKTRLKWIDQMLMEGTDEAHEKLLAFFADEKEIAPYGNRSNAMIEMIVIMDIYKAEVEMGEAHTIFDRKIEGRRMGETELTAYMRAFRFLMWRLEFTKEADAGEKLIQFLKEAEIQSVFHYIPLHTAPAGQKFGRFSGEDRYTTKESERLLRLPLYYGLKEEQVLYIVGKVKEFYGR